MPFLSIFKLALRHGEPEREGRFHVVIVEEDGWFTAEAPELPGCVTQGRSIQEAKDNMIDAIVGCLQVRTELGLPTRLRRIETEVTVPRELIVA